MRRKGERSSGPSGGEKMSGVRLLVRQYHARRSPDADNSVCCDTLLTYREFVSRIVTTGAATSPTAVVAPPRLEERRTPPHSWKGLVRHLPSTSDNQLDIEAPASISVPLGPG